MNPNANSSLGGGGFPSFSYGGNAPAFSTPAASSALQAPASSTSSLTFGAPSATSLPTFGAQPTTASLPTFGNPASTTSLSFGPPAASAAPSFGSLGSTPSLSFGAATISAAPSFGTSIAGTAPAFAAPATTSAPAFGTSTASALPAFGVPTTKSLPTFEAITPAPKTTTTTAAPISLSLSITRPAAGLTSTTSTTQSTAAAATNQLSFSQIEELINKYTLELEEQEKVFINQATQVNTWDNLLNNNSKKIVELSNAVEKVKGDQKCLEDELKFIETQHNELEECITPLKNELDKVPHVDMEKAQTYLLAESLDTQLRQMSEDLKEVIEHLNEVNKLQNPNDPIVQIGRILNAHMNSLQWIESSTSQINAKLDDINKMYDTLRRDTERSLRLTYCD